MKRGDMKAEQVRTGQYAGFGVFHSSNLFLKISASLLLRYGRATWIGSISQHFGGMLVKLLDARTNNFRIHAVQYGLLQPHG